MDFDFLVNLENTSDYFKEFEKKKLFDNEKVQQKDQEQVEIEDKHCYENASDANKSNEVIDILDENLSYKCTNVDNNYNNFSPLITAENNLVSHNSTSNTFLTSECRNQNYTMDKLINNITHPEINNSNQNESFNNFYMNEFCSDTTNIISHTIHKDLLQQQDVASKNNISLQTNDGVFVLLNSHTHSFRTNRINKSNNVQIGTPLNVSDLFTTNNLESSTVLNNAYGNSCNEENQGKKCKSNTISDTQIRHNNNIFKSKKRKKIGNTFLMYYLTAHEGELFDSYKSGEYSFRYFCKPIIKKILPQHIKGLETSNLSNDRKYNSTIALTSLSNFLDIISAISIKRKQPTLRDFLSSLDSACEKFNLYYDVFQQLLILKSSWSDLHMVDKKFFCRDNCNLCDIQRLINSINTRLDSFYSRLKKLRESFKIGEIYNLI